MSSPKRTTYEDDSGRYVGYVDGVNQRHGHGVFTDKLGTSYKGGWKRDKAHGFGKKEYASGDSYSGYFQNGQRSGWGKYTWHNNDSYVGHWRRGKMHGKGVLMHATGDIYDGEWVDGVQHGRGVKRLKNGEIYDGEWANGKVSGKGCKIFTGGDVHMGFYSEDRRHGYGEYTWSNSDAYVGGWVNGKMEGLGVKSMKGGDEYSGEWSKDRARGRGIKMFAVGDSHHGMYVDDNREGWGSYTWSNGDCYEGDWKQGRMNGLGVKRMSNGDEFDGEWKDDKANGYGIKSFANGDSHEGYYVSDRRHGYGAYHWHSGDHYEGNWDKGSQHGRGVYRFADDSEKRVFHGSWERGRKHKAGILILKNGNCFVQMWDEGILLWQTPVSGVEKASKLVAKVADKVISSDFQPNWWSGYAVQAALNPDDSEEDVDVSSSEDNSEDISSESDDENDGSDDDLVGVEEQEQSGNLRESKSEIEEEGDDAVQVIGGMMSHSNSTNSAVDSDSELEGFQEDNLELNKGSGSAIFETDYASARLGTLDDSKSTESSDEAKEYDDALGVGLKRSAVCSALDAGPSFQLGHEVSQILSVDEFDEWDGEAGSAQANGKTTAHQLNGERSEVAESDISLRLRNPKRNRSIEIRATDISRGSCSSPVSARQRVQILRERDSVDTDLSEALASVSSMSIASPSRVPTSSVVDDSDVMNFSCAPDDGESSLV